MNYSYEELEKIKEYYKPTEEQYAEMYEKCKYITFYNLQPSKNPTGVFVGGQTGSGKGGIDVYSQQQFKEHDVLGAVLDVDVYRAVFPKVDEILAKYPTIYTDITAQTTGRIVQDIIQYAVDNKYNFIFEGTMRNTTAFETMKRMPEDFRKVVRVMAVNKVESLLTAFERNDEQVNISGYGRFTNVATHNITYNGVLNTVRTIESERPDIIIELFTRGKDMTTPLKIYSSEEASMKASEKISEQRKVRTLTQEKIDSRLQKLLTNLRPKDKYEEEQLKLLKMEIYENSWE